MDEGADAEAMKCLLRVQRVAIPICFLKNCILGTISGTRVVSGNFDNRQISILIHQNLPSTRGPLAQLVKAWC